MRDSQNMIPSPGQEMSTHPSRLGILGLAVLASLLYLALMDAAAETFMSHSPLRWIVGGTVVGYLVLSMLLWRKLSWETKASLSFCFLLGLIALAAWRLGSSDSPITLLRQPTSTLLSVATILGILLAGWILARLKFLPWPARVALVLFAAYGVAAFAVGIATRTPYTALLHGGSVWEKAPFWLQGAFIGAVAVLPAALLLQLVTGVPRIRAGQLAAWGRQVLALGLCASIAGSSAAPTSGLTLVQVANPGEASAASGMPWSLLPVPDSDANAWLDGIHKLQAKTNSETYDITAAANLIGNDVPKILAFLHHDFSFDPYRGSLRGPQGTLMAKGGNAIDLSRLLCALLSVHGYSVRLVSGQLNDADAQRLLSRAAQPTPLAVPSPATAEEVAQVSGLQVDQVRRLMQTAEARGSQFRSLLQERVQRDTSSIEEFLRRAQIQLQPQSAPTLDSLRTHVWAQAQIDSEWRDLDPSFPDSQVGQRFAEPQGEIDVNAPPDEWVHLLRLRILTSNGSSGDGQGNEVLNMQIRVPDLVGKALTLGFEPAEEGQSPDTANAFRPVLVIDSKPNKGSNIYLDAAKAPKSGPGDLFGSVVSGGEPQPLSRAWLELTLEGPGLTPTRATRTIVASPQGAAASDANAVIEQAREQLVSLYQFVVAGGALSPDWLIGQQVSFLEQFAKPGIDSMEMIPLDLFHLVAAATRPEAFHSPGMQRCFKQPMVVGQRLRFRRGPGERLALVKSVDIIFNGSEALTGDPLDMIRQGVLETHLERLIMEGMEVANTSVVFERSRAPVLVLRPGEPNALAQSSLSAEAKQGITEDLAAGYVVIVPSERVTVAGAPTIGWWRVQLQGGETLGRMESGEGQAMTERVGYMLPSLYSTGAGFLCSKQGKTGGLCNPCLIAFAGLVGTFLGFAWWAQWGKSWLGAIAGIGLGIYGIYTKGGNCVGWVMQQAQTP